MEEWAQMPHCSSWRCDSQIGRRVPLIELVIQRLQEDINVFAYRLVSLNRIDSERLETVGHDIEKDRILHYHNGIPRCRGHAKTHILELPQEVWPHDLQCHV